MHKNILIPTDGSNLSRDAMLKGIDFAMAGLLLGSETQKVLLHSKVPVFVSR